MDADSYKTIDLKLAIPLRFLGSEEDAIKKKINEFVSQYISEGDGYLIKWRNLRILDKHGTIIDDQPYVFKRISFEGVIFKPAQGKLLKGTVAKITNSYLIARAFDSISVTITIPEEFKNHPVMKAIMLGSEIYFKLRSRSRGMIDQECIELSEGIMNKQIDDVYAYRDQFEY